jgi:D-alanyl-lipoteichoic acid acyltransferase DltB (MBOAT superfamily)
LDTASVQFVLFGLVAAAISNFSRSPVWRSAVLMMASLVFLGLLDHHPTAFIPLLGFLLLGYAGLYLVTGNWSKSLIWILCAVILAYAWLKKYTVLPEGIFIGFPYFTIGLSYIFFRVLHLLIETADGDGKQHISPGAYLLYTLNFTTLISGPIQRYNEFARDQFATQPLALGPRVIGLQLERIVRGFFKVNVLAMLLLSAQEGALEELQHSLSSSQKFLSAFLLAVVYPFFLYLNFSGYIDLVMAFARLMRIRLPENFDRPFSASSFLDFWNRWHITLSTWLKTYVFNPLLLALMRRVSSLTVQPFLGVLCFFVTFFLIGVWHGRTSEFVVFGVLQGAGVAINKLWQIGLTSAMGRNGYKKLANNLIYIVLGRGLTFSWFAFSLFWFWAHWQQIGMIFTALSATQWLGVWLSIWLSATIALTAWEWFRAAMLELKISEESVISSRYTRVVYATALGLISLVLTVLLNQPPPVIVYKTF